MRRSILIILRRTKEQWIKMKKHLPMFLELWNLLMNIMSLIKVRWQMNRETTRTTWMMTFKRSLKHTRTWFQIIISERKEVSKRRNQLFGEKKQSGALNLSLFTIGTPRNWITKRLPTFMSSPSMMSRNPVNKIKMIYKMKIIRIGGIIWSWPKTITFSTHGRYSFLF